jgi:serine/threonine-protein kinase
MSSPDFWSRIREARLGRVLLVYAGASWAVIEATGFFIEQFGLPDWFVPAALLLLLIGLVVVVGTALVQARPAVEPIPSRPGIATPTDASAGRLLTWRNAVMGGVFAFASWGVAAAGWMLLGPGDESSAPGGLGAEVQKLVVLPFENLSGEQDEYFADGVTDAITARLAALSGLGIISRQSAVQYRNSEKTAQQIGAELGVDYILEGTVQRERPNDPASRVRVIPQLIRIEDDTHVWAATYDEDMAEVFRVQSEIAERVAQALDVTILEADRPTLEARPSESLEAYDYYLRGNDYLNRGLLAYLERAPVTAVGLYERAVELDPDFALAWAALARAHNRVYEAGFDPDAERLLEARDAAHRALLLEPRLAEAHLALGEYYVQRLEHGRAMDEFEAARQVNPNDAVVLRSIGAALQREGRFDEALSAFERAAVIDPRSVSTAVEYGAALGRAGRHAEAEANFDRAVALAPDQIAPYASRLAYYLFDRGDLDRSRGVLEAGSQRMGRMAFAANLMSWDYAYFRILADELDGSLAQLSIESFAHDTVSYYYYYFARAWNHTTRGEPETASVYYDSARVILDDWVGRTSEGMLFRRQQAWAYAGLGRGPEAVAIVERVLEMSSPSEDALDGNDNAELLARIHALLGQRDEALDVLAELVERAPRYRASLRVDPAWNALRDDPRFETLLSSDR